MMTKQQVQNLINIYAASSSIAWAECESVELFNRTREQINLLNERMYFHQRYLNAFINDQQVEIYAENILMLCWTGK